MASIPYLTGHILQHCPGGSASEAPPGFNPLPHGAHIATHRLHCLKRRSDASIPYLTGHILQLRGHQRDPGISDASIPYLTGHILQRFFSGFTATWTPRFNPLPHGAHIATPGQAGMSSRFFCFNPLPHGAHIATDLSNLGPQAQSPSAAPYDQCATICPSSGAVVNPGRWHQTNGWPPQRRLPWREQAAMSSTEQHLAATLPVSPQRLRLITPARADARAERDSDELPVAFFSIVGIPVRCKACDRRNPCSAMVVPEAASPPISPPPR